MFTRTRIARIIIVIFVSMSLTSWCNAALFGLADPPQEPNYVPDEIIVKFEQAVADSLEQQLFEGNTVDELKLTPSLDNLNNIYKVINIESVIKNFKAERKCIENLINKQEALLTPKERHLVRRLKRAPAGAIVPDLDRIYRIQLEPGQSAPWAATQYENDPNVQYGELNYIYSICIREPNDPYYQVQWTLNNTGQPYPISSSSTASGTPDCDIDATEAWGIHVGSSQVIVAVVDTCVDYNHRDMVYNMWTDPNGNHGYDFFNDDHDPMDDMGHGTHCAGTIATDANNGFDIAGVSWNAKIMAVKWMDSGGGGFGEGVSGPRRF